jgi:hypothetical protein
VLADEHARQVAQLRPLLTKIRQLEIELQHLVFDLYGLTPRGSSAPPLHRPAPRPAGVGGGDSCAGHG